MSIEEGIIRAIVREELTAGLSKNAAQTPKIIPKTMTIADKEYSIALPAGVKKFMLHMRETSTAFRLAFEKGRVADPKEPYFTVPAGTPYNEDNLKLAQKFKIYVACGSAGKTIEVIAWS